MTPVEISTLVGKTLTAIRVYKDEDYIVFETNTGERFQLYNSEICGACYIQDIDGDVEDLLGSPLLVAEAVTGHNAEPLGSEWQPGGDYISEDDTYEWTFYKLDTVKGGVTIRWLGVSNGHYSVEVEFVQLEEDDEEGN